MTESGDPPSRAEWKVLRIVFELGSAAAREVTAEAERRHGWSASTVKTMLRRLVDKGHLKVRRVGNSFLYKPARSAVKALCEFADTLLENAVDGTVGPVLQYLVRKSRLTEGELDELRSLLDEKGGEPS
ncbi:MAG: BlaI/MecI/CopY family transcriptional regulator [Planctomycetes bacterium]|nr:BlaI/MecI/CopY family transcriptional regulator [Planctomycetota bacterium]